jgi:bacteriocin-like protein
MKNRMQADTPGTDERQPTWNNMTELTDAELQAVSGGLNPQPLPPCHEEIRSM